MPRPDLREVAKSYLEHDHGPMSSRNAMASIAYSLLAISDQLAAIQEDMRSAQLEGDER